MAKVRRMFDDVRRSYKTQENAVKVIERVAENSPLEKINYIIIVNSIGRFIPVVKLTGDALMYTRYFADNGCCVC